MVGRWIERAASYAWPVLLWLIIADWGKLSTPLLLPPLQDVVLRLWELMGSIQFGQDCVATLFRWSVGFGLGAFCGGVVGLILGIQRRWYRFLEFALEFLRAMPVTAIFPLFLILFGIGDRSKIAMAFLPTFLLVLINGAYGVLHASRARLTMAAVFGANKLQIFCSITFFEALPQLFIGLRLAVSLSLVVTVVSEMFIGSDFGLGQRIYDAYLTNNINTLYAVLIVLGGIGYSLNKMVLWTEHRIVHWVGRR
jgi:NitT/TauT family transport system permease protein